MAKRIFWSAVNNGNDTPCAPCPFVGVEVNSFDDFIEDIVKGRLFVKTGGYSESGHLLGKYPSVLFPLTKNRSLLFAGYNRTFKGSPIMSNGKPSKWAIYDNNVGDIMMYIDIRNSEHQRRVWNMFKDSEDVQKQIDALTAICNAQGGLTFSLK